MYKKIATTVSAFIFIYSILYSQNTPGILFNLRQLPDQSWGVFIKPDREIIPSSHTIPATGQVTIIAPDFFEYTNFISYSGMWVENARVNSPLEAMGRSYISFGFVTNEPKLQIVDGMETLLFSFTSDEMFEGAFALIDNSLDPFLPPNTFSSH